MGFGKKYSQLERDQTLGDLSHHIPPSPTSGQDAATAVETESTNDTNEENV